MSDLEQERYKMDLVIPDNKEILKQNKTRRCHRGTGANFEGLPLAQNGTIQATI